MRAVLLALLWLTLLAGLAWSQPSPDLRAGLSVTHWWRYPARLNRSWLVGDLDDRTFAAIRAAGFTHLRLPVDPAIAAGREAWLAETIARIEHQGLAVLIVPTAPPPNLPLWWRALLPRLPSGPLTVPELLNEPTLPAPAWAQLQAETLAAIRAVRPEALVILTGAAWGDIDGLLAAPPLPDPRTVWSIHFYEPAELTSLAAYRPGLDRAALVTLPFPVTGRPCAAGTDPATRAVAAFYCRLHWDEARIDARFAQAASWSTRTGTTIHLGEFGATRSLPPATRLAWLRAVRRAAEANHIGWTLWGYDDAMGFESMLDAPTLAALGLRQP